MALGVRADRVTPEAHGLFGDEDQEMLGHRGRFFHINVGDADRALSKGPNVADQIADTVQTPMFPIRCHNRGHLRRAQSLSATWPLQQGLLSASVGPPQRHLTFVPKESPSNRRSSFAPATMARLMRAGGSSCPLPSQVALRFTFRPTTFLRVES